MFATIHNTVLVNPIFNLLALVFQVTGNLGWSIIGLTIIVKTVTIPVILPSIKSIKKQRDLQPQIDKLKKKYKYDKKKQAEKQMELMKEHGVNPASGCYTMIITILIFTALYSVIRQITQVTDLAAINSHLYVDFLKFSSLDQLSPQFLYLDLTKPDPFYIMAALAGLTQFVMAKMNMPYSKAGIKAAKKTPDKKDDIAYNMQQQSLFIMPAMMAFLGISMPSGVIIYIITSTIFSIVQNYFVNGWGGMKSVFEKVSFGKKKKK
ncbi:YidC/Oxa1 family membrane protein insertase [Patescibacteria group bacterium]